MAVNAAQEGFLAVDQQFMVFIEGKFANTDFALLSLNHFIVTAQFGSQGIQVGLSRRPESGLFNGKLLLKVFSLSWLKGILGLLGNRLPFIFQRLHQGKRSRRC